MLTIHGVKLSQLGVENVYLKKIDMLRMSNIDIFLPCVTPIFKGYYHLFSSPVISV